MCVNQNPHMLLLVEKLIASFMDAMGIVLALMSKNISELADQKMTLYGSCQNSKGL